MYNSIIIFNNQKYVIITLSMSGILTDKKKTMKFMKTSKVNNKASKSKEKNNKSFQKYIFNVHEDIKKSLQKPAHQKSIKQEYFRKQAPHNLINNIINQYQNNRLSIKQKSIHSLTKKKYFQQSKIKKKQKQNSKDLNSLQSENIQHQLRQKHINHSNKQQNSSKELQKFHFNIKKAIKSQSKTKQKTNKSRKEANNKSQDKLKKTMYILKQNQQKQNQRNQGKSKQIISIQMQKFLRFAQTMNTKEMIKAWKNNSKNNMMKLINLQKVNKIVRINSINFVSKFCCELGLNKQIFFSTVNLMDRYLNEQIVLNRIKILAISAVLLVLKLQNSLLSLIVSTYINNLPHKKVSSQELYKIYNQKKIPTNDLQFKRHEPKIQMGQIIRIELLVKKLDNLLQVQFQSPPKHQEIIEFQSLIMLQQQFKIIKINLNTWINFLTLSWDGYLYRKKSTHNIKELFFRKQQNVKNYLYLMQTLLMSLCCVELYTFDFCQIVIAAIFLICRVRSERTKNGFDKYRKQLLKSNNLIFVDKFGINSLFSQFLQGFNINFQDILAQCKFLGTFLYDQAFLSVDESKYHEITDQSIFQTHLHCNSSNKIFNNLQ